MSKEQEIINESLVLITQNAVIDYSSIPRLIKSVEARINELDLENLEATEENKGEIKKLRTKLKNEFNEYERARKEIKNLINNPYDDFLKEYAPLENLLKNADNLLKDKVDEVENLQKEQKKNNVIIYFNDLKVLLNDTIKDIGFNLDFLSFNKLDLNINMTITETALQKQIKSTLERVCDELRVIAGNNQKARLYTKYIAHLDLTRATLELQNELRQEELIINNTSPNVKENDVKVDVELKENKVDESPIVEEIVELFFRIEDTKRNIEKVRQFMLENNINYKIVKRKGE